MGSPRPVSALLLALCLCAPVATHAAEAPWLEVRSPHFAVVTNASEKSGRRIAWQFEQVRAVVAKLWPWAKIEAGKPVVILAARDEGSFRALAPAYWERKVYKPTAVFVTGRDRHYALLRSDVRDSDEVGQNPYYTAYEAYLFLALDQAFPAANTPLWFERGLAQVLASTLVTESEIQVGRPIRWKIETLRDNPRLSVPDMLRVDRKSPYYTQENQARSFDAQSWAFVHYLMYGEQRRHAAGLSRFAGLVRQGRAGDEAFREAFGDPTAFNGPLSTYIERSLWSFGRFELELGLEPAGFTSRPLPMAESAALRALFHVAMGRPNEARALADEARRDPALPLPWEVDAMLLDAEGEREEARAAFAKAVEKGSRSFYAHYRLAQLEWTPGRDRGQLEARAARLRTAVELNPDSAATHSLLGETLATLGQTQEGVRLAQRATELEPRDSYHHLALSRALWAARRREDAMDQARAALLLSRSDSERAQAQDLIDFLTRSATPDAAGAARSGDEPAQPDTAAQAACFQSKQAEACARLAPLAQQACAQGSGSACAALGWLHENGHASPRTRRVRLSSTVRPALPASARPALCGRRCWPVARTRPGGWRSSRPCATATRPPRARASPSSTRRSRRARTSHGPGSCWRRRAPPRTQKAAGCSGRCRNRESPQAWRPRLPSPSYAAYL